MFQIQKRASCATGCYCRNVRNLTWSESYCCQRPTGLILPDSTASIVDVYRRCPQTLCLAVCQTNRVEPNSDQLDRYCCSGISSTTTIATTPATTTPPPSPPPPPPPPSSCGTGRYCRNVRNLTWSESYCCQRPTGLILPDSTASIVPPPFQ